MFFNFQSTSIQRDEASVDFNVGVVSDVTTRDAVDGSTQVDELDDDHRTAVTVVVADNAESEDSGSGNSDLDNVEKSTKKSSTKLKKFFNFSRKKEKVV